MSMTRSKRWAISAQRKSTKHQRTRKSRWLVSAQKRQMKQSTAIIPFTNQALIVIDTPHKAVATARERPFRFTIGHYGGIIADVPKGHWRTFTKQFPARMFPREVRETNITEAYTDVAQQRFKEAYPKSAGKVFSVYFRSGSKGEQFADKLADRMRKKGYDPFKESW